MSRLLLLAGRVDTHVLDHERDAVPGACHIRGSDSGRGGRSDERLDTYRAAAE